MVRIDTSKDEHDQCPFQATQSLRRVVISTALEDHLYSRVQVLLRIDPGTLSNVAKHAAPSSTSS